MLFLIFRFPELKNDLGSFLVRQKSGAPPALKAPENYPRGRFSAHNYIMSLSRVKVDGAEIKADTAGIFPRSKTRKPLRPNGFRVLAAPVEKKIDFFLKKLLTIA